MQKYNRPVLFYSLSLFIPWMIWSYVAYLSHLPEQTPSLLLLQSVLGMAGLVAPFFIALGLFLSNRVILDDFKSRFLNMTSFPVIYLLITLLLIFSSMVLAQLISVFFGHSLSQFVITGQPSFTSMQFSPWFILLFAPVVEELAWHSYGTDTLRRSFNLFTTSMIFAFYWVFWHLPLSMINGYYHSNMVADGWIYALNFVFSLFVFVILMNWLYYKTNRNILITVAFHLTANVSNEIFATHPDSKVIQTVLLLIVTIIVLIKEKDMFFSKTLPEDKLVNQGNL
ncbi:MAG: CPBP family intramembrane metalloprotease [Bacteroidetes bacterium]|nr:CPBP family intramembrane metalloprotease [Bacteroidota bacterium]